MYKTPTLAATVALSLMLPGAAAAATAVATTDVNVRSGPGPQFPVVGAIQQNGAVELTGCLAGSSWCQVNNNGYLGWSYGRYLAIQQTGGAVIVSDAGPQIGIPTVAYEATGTTVVASAEPAGTLVAPSGTTTVTRVAPPPHVQTYVVENRLDPVLLDGEVVIGAGIPETVELYTIPEYEYHYTYVNQVPVLVEPQSRRVVYVYR